MLLCVRLPVSRVHTHIKIGEAVAEVAAVISSFQVHCLLPFYLAGLLFDALYFLKSAV